jgi:hypothetical protein
MTVPQKQKKKTEQKTTMKRMKSIKEGSKSVKKKKELSLFLLVKNGIKTLIKTNS